MKDNNIPLFSIVIPLYNKTEHIQRAIDSVLDQTLQYFEIIVVNDGSTDGGENIVKQYTDPRITLIEQKNSGVSAARNRGILNSNGEYVAFLDADDFWFPDFLDTINDLIKKFPEAGAYATAYKVKEPNGKYYEVSFSPIPPFPWEGIISNYFECIASGKHSICTDTVCIKKDIFDSVGLFDTSFSMGEDTDMWIRLYLKTKIAFSTKIKAIYFRDAINRSEAIVDDYPFEVNKEINRFLSPLYLEKIPYKFHYLFKKGMGIKRFDVIKRYIYLGNKKEAFRVFLCNRQDLNLQNQLITLIMLVIPTFMVNPIKKILKRKLG